MTYLFASLFLKIIRQSKENIKVLKLTHLSYPKIKQVQTIIFSLLAEFFCLFKFIDFAHEEYVEN